MTDTLIGAIIGAISAILGGVIGQMVTYFYNRKNVIREEKKVAYEAAENILFDLAIRNNNTYNEQEQNEYNKQFKMVSTKLALYAPEHIVFSFTKLYELIESDEMNEISCNQYEKLSEQLLKEMKKDLGIKG